MIQSVLGIDEYPEAAGVRYEIVMGEIIVKFTAAEEPRLADFPQHARSEA